MMQRLLVRELLRLRFWRQFFRIGIAGEGDPPDDDGVEVTDDAAPDDDAPGDDESPPADGDTGGDETPPDDVGEVRQKRAGASETIRELKRELKDRNEKFDREIAELKRSAPPPQQRRDETFEAEESRLKQLDLTTESGKLEKWQIDSNREIRAARMYGQQAIQQASDIADRSKFEQLATTNPSLHKRYAAKVEENIAKMRAQGQQVPPREEMLRYLVGHDMVAGKLKPAAGKSTASGQGVPRGKTPGARSDVSGKGGGKTESEKRRARLEGVQI